MDNRPGSDSERFVRLIKKGCETMGLARGLCFEFDRR